MAYEITLIPGDGVGPELSEATKRCIEATGVAINWDVQEAGDEVFQKEGNPLPQRVLDSIKRTKVCIKGPITTPVAAGYSSLNVRMRKEFDLYAGLRPCKLLKGVQSRYSNVDLVIVRENTEDLYAGIEFPKGAPETKVLADFVGQAKGAKIREDAAVSLKPISVFGSKRIAEFAFNYAVENGRKKVSCVHKANIMKQSDGLFLQTCREVALQFPQIEFSEVIVDNLCMQLVQRPEQFDVLVLPNLYGDIVSDLCAGLVGGLGVVGGANIGNDIAIFEAVHGSAPKYKGQNKVNPAAMILSGVMMLNYLGEKDAANALYNAVQAVIAEGKNVTYDLKPSREDPSAVGTKEMADAIIAGLATQ